MNRNWLAVMVIGTMFAARSLAQAPPASNVPADVAQIPSEIKNLQWQSIDLSAVQPLEYDRALLLLNHVLDEVAPVRASEADLMSAYIDAQNLGPEFAATPPPAQSKAFEYSDVVKIAIALLRGPMAGSSYASEMSSMSADSLASYKHLYEGTCQRRWSEVAESIQQVRAMGSFIQSKGRMQDYQSWAKLESQNRALKYQLESQQKRVEEEKREAAGPQKAAVQANADQQLASLEQANQQLSQALQAAQQQTASAQQQTANAQQAAAQSQQQSSNASSTPTYGYGYGVPAYYGASATWCHQSTYANASRAATDQRVSNWHNTPAAGRGTASQHPAAGHGAPAQHPAGGRPEGGRR